MFCLSTQGFLPPPLTLCMDACLCIIKPGHACLCACVTAGSTPAGFGRSSGTLSWHIRVFPSSVPRPVPMTIMVLLRVCVCVCLFYQNILLFPSFPSHSRSALRLKPAVPSVSSMCASACTRVCISSFRRSECIMQIRERERGMEGEKKAEGGCEQRGGGGGLVEWK